jgi:hypothetical protein
MGDKGFDSLQNNPEKPHIQVTPGTESGTLNADSPVSLDSELAKVIAAWPSLSDDSRAMILDVLRKAGQ